VFQIEQFIESIFPSQKPPQQPVTTETPASAEDEAKLRADKDEAKWDLIYMGLAIVSILVIITVFMVSPLPDPCDPCYPWSVALGNDSQIRRRL